MPYSLSHAVVALPVAKLTKYKIPTASVFIGAMSPDFPYMLALTPTYAPGHSLTGPLVYCLMPSLLILLAWHRWLEKPNKALFALPVKSVKVDVNYFVLSCIGVLTGAYSHVLWDATSHWNGAFVIDSEFWKQIIGPLPLYKWNQYLSGVLGLGIMTLWYLCRVISAKNQPYVGNLKAGATIYFGCIASAVLVANGLHSSSTMPQLAVRSSLGIIMGAGIAAVVYASFINRITRL